MIKTVTKDDLIELGFAPGTARKIIHTGKLLLVNRVLTSTITKGLVQFQPVSQKNY